LADVLARERLAPEHAVRVALDLAEALIPVHRRGLVHRDVKPQNVLVADDGAARLIDFGLAMREQRGDPVTAGTLAYAAPEQSGMLKRPVDARSDLYSLGVVLFECLTGVPPFRTDDVSELVRMHAVALPPDPSSMVAGVPPALSAIVAMLLAKDPDDRYQSSGSLAADLRRVAADPGAMFPPGRYEQVGAPQPVDRRHRPRPRRPRPLPSQTRGP
jgi:serine/threonine protein kinase